MARLEAVLSPPIQAPQPPPLDLQVPFARLEAPVCPPIQALQPPSLAPHYSPRCALGPPGNAVSSPVGLTSRHTNPLSYVPQELLGASAEADASGNKKLPAIGEFMKNKITEYFKRGGMETTVKYVDPSYMIRSVPANASDALYCMILAQNAVHGAMAGYTGFSVGLVNNRVVYIPIPRLVATSPRIMDPSGRTWERVRNVTRQVRSWSAWKCCF